jgi:hypothetical protein
VQEGAAAAAAAAEPVEPAKAEKPERAERMLEWAVHMPGEVANTLGQVEHNRLVDGQEMDDWSLS